MDNNNIVRFQDIDTSWATQLVHFLSQQIEDLHRETKLEEDGTSQVQYSLLGEYYKDLALLHYALGSQLNVIRTEIAAAAQAYWHVFRLRGTTPAFSSEIVTLRGRPTGDETDQIERQEMHASDEMDYSLTNSRTGLLAMYLAMIGQGKDLAYQIAELVRDPPNAHYIAPESVICTPDEQHLAYALKAYLLGQDDHVLLELDQIREFEANVANQAIILRAIHSRNAQTFLENVAKQLARHLTQAKRFENQKNPEYLLDIPGLALYRMALHASIILPGQKLDDIYIPAELLSTESISE